MKAIIFKSHQRVFECFLVEKNALISATAKGSLLKGSETIVVGDEVIIREDQSGDFFIEEVLERRSEIFRQIQRENKKKVTAANVDLLIILMSGAKPKYKRGILDRFLLRASQWETPAIVVFNKMDNYNQKYFDIEFEADRLNGLEVQKFEISSKDENYSPAFLENGLVELKKFLKNKNSIFLGQSGVGKSTLITTLSDGRVDLKTQEIGRAGKGTHTTTWSEMIDLGDFKMIDSPGIRSFSIDDLFEEDLKFLFPDLVDLFPKCEFFDCEHEESSRGCYFNSLEPGRKRDLIFSRLDSYKNLLREISQIPDWKKSSS